MLEDPRASANFGNRLTPRELQVLELTAHGMTNARLAIELGVSVHAVKYHLASIYRKLSVANRTEAAAAYLERIAPAAARDVVG